MYIPALKMAYLHKMGYPIISREKITLQDELSGKSNGI